MQTLTKVKNIDRFNARNEPIGKMVYRMKYTGHGSDFYGPCEVCDKHMSEAYIQTSGIVDEVEGEKMVLNQKITFAHENCLLESRA